MSGVTLHTAGRSTFADVIRAAIPDATTDDCEHVLWERTPYPVGRIAARSLFKAACGWRRAAANKIRLCDFCDNRADGGWTCESCSRAMARATGIGIGEDAPP